MYTVVQSKDKAPPGNRVGPYYSTVVCATPHLSLWRQKYYATQS